MLRQTEAALVHNSNTSLRPCAWHLQEWDLLYDGPDNSHKLTSLRPGTRVAVKFKVGELTSLPSSRRVAAAPLLSQTGDLCSKKSALASSRAASAGVQRDWRERVEQAGGLHDISQRAGPAARARGCGIDHRLHCPALAGVQEFMRASCTCCTCQRGPRSALCNVCLPSCAIACIASCASH